MAQELTINNYYHELRDKNFIDTNFLCKMGVEFFLSMLLFKGDLSRVVYSKEDIAFRRRVETMGNGDVKEGQNYSYLNLGLPFAIYSQSGSFEEDDRGSTQNASQIVKGVWDPYTGINVKAAAVKVEYESTVFFSRREDINIASQLLFWEKTPKAPLYYVVENELCGMQLNYPVFITLEEIDSNPEYEERQWLEKSKIFPMKLKFTIRTYQTLIEDVDGRIKLPLRFHGLYGYNDEEVVFTQKTSLIWADAKWSQHKHFALDEDARVKLIDDGQYLKEHKLENSGLVEQKLEDKETDIVVDQSEDGDVIYRDDDRLDKKLLNEGKAKRELLDGIIKDTVEGYFNEDRDCQLLEFHQNVDATTEKTIQIDWKIKPEDVPNFKSISVYIPGVCQASITDVDQTSFTVENVYPGSKYKCTLIVYSCSDSKLTYNLDLETKGEKILGNKLSDLLVGKTFTQL